jgi:alpha-amylase
VNRSLPVALLIGSVLAFSGCAPVPEKTDVGIQLFMYNWTSVAQECEQSLGPQGIDWVLVSPPQDHLDDAPWWVHYQPISYDIDSRLGTRDEFAQMVKVCGDSGVKVIVDAVINHMAGREAGFSWTGQSFEKYEYENLYSRADFHTCDLTNSGQIENYFDKEQVQRCELLGLSDLATGSPSVQATILGFLNDLLDLGVAGFRIDAAKHMSHQDLEEILGQLPEDTIIFHEVIRGGGEPINPLEYVATGKLWEFWFPKMVLDSLLSQWAPEISQDADPEDLLPSQNAISFITNHDTERNGKSLSVQLDPRLFNLGTLYMLGSDYGTPMLYSGYVFDSFDSPPPLNSDGTVADVDCKTDYTNLDFGDFYCQQRDPEIQAMLKWRKMVMGTKTTRPFWSESVTAFSREGKGFFALNVSDGEIMISLETDMNAGTYCNLIQPGCQEVRVSDSGVIELAIPGRSAVAIAKK